MIYTLFLIKYKCYKCATVGLAVTIIVTCLYFHSCWNQIDYSAKCSKGSGVNATHPAIQAGH